MSKSGRQIRQSFLKLSHIIYNKRYLIPAPPRDPPPTFILWAYQKVHEITSSQKEIPRTLIFKQLSQHYNANHENDPEIRKAEEERQKKQQAYERQLLEYRNNYIEPLSPPMNPYYYYNQVHFNDFTVKHPNDAAASFRALHNGFRTLSAEQRQKYKQKADEINRERDKKYKEIRQRLQIPKSNMVSSYGVFMLDNMKNMEETSDLALIWKEIPKPFKLDYEHRSIILRQKCMEQLNTFLRTFGLTHDDFLHIKEVMKEYRKYVNEQKSKKKAAKALKLSPLQPEQAGEELSWWFSEQKQNEKLGIDSDSDILHEFE